MARVSLGYSARGRGRPRQFGRRAELGRLLCQLWRVRTGWLQRRHDLRQSSPDNRIEVELQPGRLGAVGKLSMIERVHGERRLLGEAPADVGPGEWVLLEAEVRGPRALVWLDGEPRFETAVQAQHGQFGLIAIGDSSRTAIVPLRRLYYLESGSVQTSRCRSS